MDITNKESGTNHINMVRKVLAGLQEVLLQGPHNEGHKDVPYIKQLENLTVMNQVFTSIMETTTSQQHMAKQLLQIQAYI